MLHLPADKSKCLDELLEPAPLVDRIAPALADLGLRRIISWVEANYCLDAVRYYDEHSAWLWRRRQELIAKYEAEHRN